MSKPSRPSGLENLAPSEITLLSTSNSGALTSARYVDLDLDFRHYDQLPSQVRCFIQSSILDRDAIEIWELYLELDHDLDALMEILYLDEREVQQANPYTSQHVRPLPYVRVAP